MAKTFGSPAAFKASLEDRLKRVAAERGLPLNALRLKLVIERLLARLFLVPGPPWLLKGGYAMELRYRPRARTTHDIDLTVDQGGMTKRCPPGDVYFEPEVAWLNALHLAAAALAWSLDQEDEGFQRRFEQVLPEAFATDDPAV